MDQLSKIRIGFLISGYGSNLLKVLLNLQKDPHSNFIPSLILSNKNIIKDIKKKSREIDKNIKIHENIKNLNTIDFTSSDLIFSIGYMKKIEKNIFDKYLTINLHPSILPNYKGLMTHKRMIINNEKYYGFTIHRVNQSIDDGKILFQIVSKLKNLNEYDLNKAHKKLEHNNVYKALKKICIKLDEF
ncbi:MAG: formyltransferase family protein [Proteobacteria bacterium]|nr:formyltransferase family protein [Pseudomonadota bacterium]